MSQDKFEDYLKSKLSGEIAELNAQRVILHTNYWKFFLTTADFAELVQFGTRDDDYPIITLTDIAGFERFLTDRNLHPHIKKWDDLTDPTINYIEVSLNGHPQWAT